MTFDELKQYIRKLSKSQRKVFDHVCIGEDGKHPPKVLSYLEDNGLIRSYDDSLVPTKEFPFPMTMKRYEVASLQVHMAWCEICAEELRDE